MDKYKNADEFLGGASPSVSNISIGQLFLETGEVEGKNEKAKPYSNAWEYCLQKESHFISPQHWNWPHRKNPFLIPLSSAENESSRCEGQWTFPRQAGEGSRSFLLICWAPSLLPILSPHLFVSWAWLQLKYFCSDSGNSLMSGN